MAINIKFDLAGNPELPTMLLAKRNGNILGQLNVEADSVDLSDKFNDVSEFSFILNKYVDGKLTNLWEEVVDFKLIYCKEWDTWFEIKVELDEKTKTTKTVFCTQLGYAELSQIKLYNVEINTESDIERDDYKVSILYDKDDPKASILDRMIEKAPHYRIAHVDPTIAKIQRSFSFDDVSINDGFQNVGEEIGCLFLYPSKSVRNSKIQRDIYVYDLQQNCNDCGHRGEFVNECPKCGSKNIKYGYGEDTLIFVTSDELASNGIKLTTDIDSVKNCFKLEAGDDLMTATIRNCNPNGTDYIWRFSDDIKKDMSDDLAKKIDSYNDIYKYYNNEYILDIDDELLSRYNAIVEKYAEDNDELKTISKSIKGYSSLMDAYYNTVDLALYLKSVLVPLYDGYLTDELDNLLIDELDNFLMYKISKQSKLSSEQQAKMLTHEALSPISVANINTASLATINSTILAMAKIIVRSTYKVQINTSELIDDGAIKIWSGNFVITNYSDEEDTAISEIVSVIVNDDYENFIKQKMTKILNKEDTDDLSVTGLFKKDYSDFRDDLSRYALNSLVRFRDACQSCLDILIEQGVGNEDALSNGNNEDNNLYKNLYLPYYNRLISIEEEIKIRENEINTILGLYNSDGNLVSDGMQSNIEKCRNKIREVLDFEKYLGHDLWIEFCSYRREDKYSNSNYISDGLNNAELFKMAKEFFEVAENEIYKSSELQHSISTTLNNLLAIPKFKPLVKYFNVGNWIRVKIDDVIYKLRLLEYGISYKDFDKISVEFSDVTKIKNSVTDVKSVLSQASSMATTYSSVKRQAGQGEKSKDILNNWIESGLNATNTKIISTENQNQVWDKNGILCKQYDPITETYSDEQLKIVNSTIAITDNNWETTKTAIGKYFYTDPITKELKSAYGVNGETIVGKLLLGERLDISNENGGLQFGANGLIVNNDVNTVAINPNDKSIFNISNDSGSIFSLNDDGELVVVGNIVASGLTLLDGTTIGTDNITGLSDVAISGAYNDLQNRPSLSKVATSGSYVDLENTPTKLSDFENDGVFITKDANNLTNYYGKTEIDGLLSSKANKNSLETIATSGLLSDAKDINEFKNWVLEQIQAALTQQNNP